MSRGTYIALLVVASVLVYVGLMGVGLQVAYSFWTLVASMWTAAATLAVKLGLFGLVLLFLLVLLREIKRRRWWRKEKGKRWPSPS